jgi:bifunctional N-acetylglucosamine-1-phosphate-uridyltransferase/glucosamine-1-phosphate-acetyltransferase GlmU-like protein
MDGLEFNIFGGKTFKDLLEEIYNNQKKKERQITTLVNELKPMVKEIGDATLLVPLIKECLEIGVKNDEQLIKMATIIQRCISNSSNVEGGFTISEEEKTQLLNDINKLNDNIKPE